MARRRRAPSCRTPSPPASSSSRSSDSYLRPVKPSQPIQVTIQVLVSQTPKSDANGNALTHDPLVITGSIDVVGANIDAVGANFDTPEGVPLVAGTVLATFVVPVAGLGPKDIASIEVDWATALRRSPSTRTRMSSSNPRPPARPSRSLRRLRSITTTMRSRRGPGRVPDPRHAHDDRGKRRRCDLPRQSLGPRADRPRAQHPGRRRFTVPGGGGLVLLHRRRRPRSATSPRSSTGATASRRPARS